MRKHCEYHDNLNEIYKLSEELIIRLFFSIFYCFAVH